ncbi:hypothetical protein [Eleftheria terrae]|uniref:hypothetical protein n=1 Tax=Eleftheria terrae TaxID=1597781 RepID=UPI00263B26A7|nr:hypothetical protein [Eleftheria terrae]WKB50503.1 hypothetical protein N7L95_00205 [Eleftheria terrae]
MEKKPKRSVKSWSTREQIAADLDEIARELEEQYGYTVDRSKILNAFCNMLFKARRNLKKTGVSVVNEETLEEALYKAIRNERG